VSDRRAYIQKAIDALFVLWVSRATLYGAFIFLLLSFMDVAVYPEHVKQFLVYRVAIALFLLLLYGLAGRIRNMRLLRYASLAAVTVSAMTIETMILQTGGDHSLYAMGIILLTVFVLAFVPTDLAFHAAMAAVIYGVYLLPILMTQNIDDWPVFFATNFFICSIMLTVLVFRYMSLQTLRQQLTAEYELTSYQTHLEAMVEDRTADLEKTIAQLEQEVEARIRAESAMERGRRLLNGVFESIQDGIVVLDTEQNIVMANKAADGMFGKELSAGFKVLKCFEVIKRTAEQCEDCRAVRAITERRPEIEAVPYSPDETGAGWLEIYTFPFYDEKGEARGVIKYMRDITERIQAAEAVKESEERFKKLLDNTPIAISMVNADGTVEYVNKKHPEILGYDLNDIPTLEHWWSLAYPVEKDRTLIKAAWQSISRRVLQGEKVSSVDRWIVCKDGVTRELELNFSTAAGRIIVSFVDITARKQAEKEVRENEANMRAMLESFDGLIYICSPDYRIEFMNEHLILRTGRNAAGEHCYAVLNERDSICPWCVNKDVFKGEIIRYEIQSPKDGRWYHVVNTPIHHDEGSVSKLAMFLDITERKKADIELKKSEERYKRLISSVTDYIYTVTIGDGREISTTHGEGCYAVTGYSSEQYQADRDLWYHMLYEDDRDSVVEQIKKMLAGERNEPLEHRIIHSSGSIRWVLNTLVPLFDKSGQLIAYDGLISDITERKMLEEELEKVRVLEQNNLKIFSRRLLDVQEEERRAIARELHDEIGQSLTGLKLSVETIADSLRVDQADNLRAIEVSLGELLSIVRHMSLNLRPAMLDDFGLANTLLWYFERYKSQTGISVFFIQDGSDRRFGQQKEIALYRIAQESMTNVARHAGVKSVLVKLEIERDRVTLLIRDEGRGFDTEKTAHSCSGLSIMRERSILLGGTFSLSSSLNKGTEVTATLPLNTGDAGQEGLL